MPATADAALVELVEQGKVKKIVASHVGTTPAIGKAMNEGQLEVELVPARHAGRDDALRRRRTGWLPHPHRRGYGRRRGQADSWSSTVATYILVPALHVDVALVRAHRGDTWGNLIYRGTSRNFNVPAAMCADYVIAEVENLYTMGELDPEAVQTPGIFVDAVVRANVGYCIVREEPIVTNGKV